MIPITVPYCLVLFEIHLSLYLVKVNSKFHDNYSKIKSAKMPQNMKSSDRFRTVSDSAVLCQLIPPPLESVTLKLRALLWEFKDFKVKGQGKN